jgi:S-adenosylmethionine hydrolase
MTLPFLRLVRPPGSRPRATLAAAFSLALLVSACDSPEAPPRALVFQSDFGVLDNAVATMKGVAFGISPGLPIYDLTHEITAYNIWEGAYRLEQTASYWPSGTVFVSVVDPGVGTDRKSVVLRTRSGHYFVTPDNGTLTLVSRSLGIDAVREIDEAVNRRLDSDRSYTFHGRDVYAYTGAKLAAGVISFEEVGPELPAEVVTLPEPPAEAVNGAVRGYVPVLDVRYGNVWTNIDRETFAALGASIGDRLQVRVVRADADSGGLGEEIRGRVVFQDPVPFVQTFGDVPVGDPLLYFNSLERLALAINMDSFAGTYGIEAGPRWRVEVRRP